MKDEIMKKEKSSSSNVMRKTTLFFVWLSLGCLTLNTACSPEKEKNNIPSEYNISWSTQSKDASESMPLVGGDIGCNVWVENGNLLFYMQRSGSLSENGEYLKMGRFRIQLNPNPFTESHSFQQNLKLKEGYIEIISKSGEKENANIKLCVDVFNPVVHIDVESADNTEVSVAYESWIRESNQELPQFYTLFPFNQFQLGDEEMQLFKNAYQVAPDFRKGKIQSWHQDGIQFARMGMTEEAADYNTRKLQDSPRRFPTFWGPGHDWVPDHNWGGSGMIGLQEMLVQTIGNQIVLFPAWPKDWDVDFKLHAPENTVIECSLKEGEIIRLEVTPDSRRKDVLNYFEKKLAL